MKEYAKRTHLKILYNNKDISKDISKFIKSFDHNDILSGSADDINITLEDREGLWSNDWLPSKGALLEVSIITKSWGADDSEEEKLLGLFEIDNITSSYPPAEVKIKGVSVPDNYELRGVDKTRSWEKVKLSVIARDIANSANMELFFDTEDIDLERVEQTEQSDLSFLLKLCEDAGLALKVIDNKIAIFDEEKYEQAVALGDIEKGKTTIINYNIDSSLRNTYAACHVKYQKGKSKQLIEYTFKDPNKTEGKTLQINKEVKSIAEAMRLAKKELRNKNKEEIKVSFSLPGSFQYYAGGVFNLKNFGAFDGRFIIESVQTGIGSGGYTISLSMRRCLSGY